MFSVVPVHAQERFTEPARAITVRTTENVTEGGWVWLLEQSRAAGVKRIDLLVKQDEDNFRSERTGRVLQSGELLVSLPGERSAEGWENSDWLVQMLARAKQLDIEIWAWWPAFHDSRAAARFPGAKFTGGDGSVFVDSSVPGVRTYQERLIKKLLETYKFDGISLDWLRYDRWADGGNGPLAKKFREKTGKALTPENIKDPVLRAVWGDLRETSIANWVEELITSLKSSHPSLKWGAYLLPPQFKEVSQNYRFLAESGLGYLQPMIYWDLWGNPPEWSGEVVAKRASWLKAGAGVVPTLDLNRPEQEHIRSFEAMGPNGVTGILWYLDKVWTEQHFGKIGRIRNLWRESRRSVRARPPILAFGSSAPVGASDILAPAQFPPDSGAWTLVLLSELYDQNILKKSDKVVPVLTLHRFVESSNRHSRSIWANSVPYMNRLVKFLSDREYEVVPLSRLQAYMMSGAPGDLPERPLVLTVDDGAHSVLEHFHPIAVEHNLPYALSVITSPVSAHGGHLDDDQKTDRQLAMNEFPQLVDSGLVELVSHTDSLHKHVRRGAGARGPAVITRRWLDSSGRRETPEEHFSRIYEDFAASRRKLLAASSSPVSILAWPMAYLTKPPRRPHAPPALPTSCSLAVRVSQALP